ncbi:aldehyde dehydrogenase family protein [Rhodococcus koreensis]|uniref:aldehyde dehydrogenase family protein n=1 Tax=Rhodococcus koreensis TaxID=99653 RepID=UPI00366CBD11
MLIGGEAVDSAETLEVEDPATGRRIAEVALAGPEHVTRAVASARATFDDGEWRWLSSAARSRLLLSIAQTVERHAEELAQLDALDAGLPISMARAYLTASIESVEYAAGIPARIAGETLPPASMRGDQFQAQVLREPLGVVGLIVPWNTPVSTAIDKVALGLATGNTVVLKPAEQTPLSALRLGELLLEAGLPPGVLNIVPGLGAVAGAALVEDPQIDKISFTGSTVTGKRIIAAAAANLTPVSLELGGKSPNVVFADADLDAAIEAAATNAFFLSGQVCTEPSRMFVQRPAYDEFLSGLCAAAEAFPVGSPLDPATLAGPLVSRAQRERVLGYIESGRREGAVVASGGTAIDGPGYYIAPTVLTGTTPDMTVEREEVFGPVVSVTPFDTIDEVIARANDTTYGLAAGVWTNDLRIAQRMTRELQAGNVWVNCFNLYDAALPFGGYKQSGWGRESGAAAIELYTQTKTVAAATLPPRPLVSPTQTTVANPSPTPNEVTQP